MVVFVAYAMVATTCPDPVAMVPKTCPDPVAMVPQLIQTLLPWYPQLVQTLLPWYPQLVQTLLSVELSKDSDIGNQDHYRPGKEPVLLIGNKPKKFDFVH